MTAPDGGSLRVALNGAGALGCLFASLLARPGLDVEIITGRRGVADDINARGVTVHDERRPNEPRTTTTKVRAMTTDEAPAKAFDVVLLLAKAGDIEAAADAAFAMVHDDGIVISLQNGLRSADVVERRGTQGVAGTTWQGAVSAGSGIVRWTAPGPTLLAPRPHTVDRAREFAERVDDDRFPVAVVGDRDAMLWEKLVAAISNSLSGALLIPVSELLGSKAAHDVLDAARAEAVAVAKALGVALDGDGLLDRLRRAGSGSVGGTVGSTYQSLMSGRRPEVDDISGAIVELAARVGVPTPVNDLLARLVEARLEVGGIGA